jgi:hypothetical protein
MRRSDAMRLARCTAAILSFLPVFYCAPRPGLNTAFAGDAKEEWAPGLKVAEATVFKDGHALLLARGLVQPDADGWFRWRDVPSPLMGGFFAFAAEEGIRLVSIRAGEEESEETVPCSGIEELIEANLGKQAILVVEESPGKTVSVEGKLVSVLRREERREVTEDVPRPPRYDPWGRIVRDPPDGVSRESAQMLGGGMLVLQEEGGTRVLELSRIRSFLLRGEAALSFPRKKKVRSLSFKFSGEPDRLKRPSKLVVVFVERGLRWIPEYRIDQSAGGKAEVRLQATVVNELRDLEGVKLNLVVGVPNFLMKGTLSPMALREAAPGLGQYFRTADPSAPGALSQMWNYASNAIQSQAANWGPPSGAETAGPGAESGGSGLLAEPAAELYLYSIGGFTLARGERAMVDLFTGAADSENRYTWDVPPAVPREFWEHFQNDRQREIAAWLKAPKVKRVLALRNRTGRPWTTGPALLFREGTIIAQELMTYTPDGGEVEIPVTVAVDVLGKREETETARAFNSLRVNRTDFTKVEIHGSLRLTNLKKEPVKVRIRKLVFGKLTGCTESGSIRLPAGEEALDDSALGSIVESWSGFGWYRGSWWSWINPFSVAEWTVILRPGEERKIEYDYFYYFL